MNVEKVNPTDQTWEVSHPRYRVYFHDAQGGADEYEVEQADVAEVIAWAESVMGERTYALYVCVVHDGLGLLRLSGTDPNER